MAECYPFRIFLMLYPFFVIEIQTVIHVYDTKEVIYMQYIQQILDSRWWNLIEWNWDYQL